MVREIIFAGLTIIATQGYAQNANQSYTQKIDGTKLSFDMQAVPSGSFTMGGEYGKEDEKPAHKVTLDGFWMGKYEITWDLFEPFLYKDYEKNNVGNITPEVDAVARPTKPYLDMTFGMGKQNHPAVAMTQYNAIQFCKWLYVRTGVFFRLPTEAEWEYACRASNTGDYSFGNDQNELKKYAWYAANSGGKSQEIGKKEPNAWGLYDMEGNVAEWTGDYYNPKFYAGLGSDAKNPISKGEELYPLVVRGGSFKDEAKDLRASARRASDPKWKQLDPQIPKSNWWFPEAPFVGFRVVRPLNPPTKEEILAYYDRAPIQDY